jgi:plastocyanin domain-containing protein
MTTTDWIVALGGVAAIAWVNWYFFFAERGTIVVTPDAARREIAVRVQGGYDPAIIRTRAGSTVRLVFDRQETSSCSEELVIPAFGIRRVLPAFQKTTIEVTPPKAGTYEFMCGMSMLHGRIIAE